MDAVHRAPPRVGPGWSNAAIAAGALGTLALLLRTLDPGRVAWIGNFGIVFSSLLIEAVPFVLLGAVVSALIEVLVPARAFERLARLPAPLQLPACGLAGLAFPVCECGSVPVARRLIAKGLTPSAAITFMLAAPVLNPVVVASTLIAYRGRATLWPMVGGRIGLGLIVAVGVGWAVGGARAELVARATGDGEPSGHAEGRTAAFFDHLAGDFLFMARYLVVGAAAAAALQTAVPQSLVSSVAGTPLLDLVAMLALAFVLSLCSESDAFVAASFVQFGVAAQLAFLVFGPMLDTKLAILYSGTFGRRAARVIAVSAAALTLAGALWIKVVFG